MNERQDLAGAVTIVIPTLGDPDRLGLSLPSAVTSLTRRKRSGDELILVDDSGEDRVESMLPELLGAAAGREAAGRPFAVRVLRAEDTLGFGAAVALATEQARTEYVLVQQDDVQLGEDALDILVGALESTAAALAAGPRLGGAGSRAIDDAGIGPAAEGAATLAAPAHAVSAGARATIELLDDQVVVREVPRGADEVQGLAPRPVAFIPSAAVLLRRREFLGLGGFDPLFAPCHWEDVDLAMTARRAGWSVLEVPGAVAVHHGLPGGLGERVPEDLDEVLVERNRLLLRWKHLATRSEASEHLVGLCRSSLEAGLAGDRRTLEQLCLAFDRLGEVTASRAALASVKPREDPAAPMAVLPVSNP